MMDCKGPVLLIDDEPVVLAMTAAVVRQFGFETMQADCVQDAVNLVRDHAPPLIISDVQMPDGGGFDLTETLEHYGLKVMPLMYLTGYDDIDTVRCGLRAGGDDFVIKGAGIDWLKQRIAFWMTTGFQCLPHDIRRRAVQDANQSSGDAFVGVAAAIAVNHDIIDRVFTRMRGELSRLPQSYGDRLVERLCILGRMSRLIIGESRGYGDFLRFPDYVMMITKMLDKPWGTDIWVLNRRFDAWSEDPRFFGAGAVPLQPFEQYDWFDPDLAASERPEAVDY